MRDWLFKEAAKLAARNIPVVVVHGINDDGTCSCGRASCTGGSRGKHPVALGWQDHATTDEDELIDQLDTDAPRNIGILLGDKGGVVDIEFDDAEGAETVRRLGIDRHQTPTYTSGNRSVHRLYRFTHKLPAKAVVKYKGLEVRTGGGGMSAQSIVPPSTHYSGSVYEWAPGLSMEDVDLMEIPADLLALICEGDAAARPSVPPRRVVQDGVGEGDRHNAIVSLTARKAFRMRNLMSETEYQDTLDELLAINQGRFNPPLPAAEVEEAFRSAVTYARSKTDPIDQDDLDAEVDAFKADGTKGVSGLGLERKSDGWHPGLWRLVVVHSEPPVYNLIVAVPQGDGWSEQRVEVDPDAFEQPSRVALAIEKATHLGVVMPSEPGEWAAMWNGKKATKKAAAELGIKARLKAQKEDMRPDPETSRDAIVAAAVLEALSGMADAPVGVKASEIELPSDHTPTWIEEVAGERKLAVVLTSLWGGVAKSVDRLSDADKRRFRRQVVGFAGCDIEALRDRWVLLTEKHYEAIGLIAQGRLTNGGRLNKWG